MRISAGVMAAQLTSKVEPIYPPEAKAQHIQGTVVVHILIGRDGRVASATVVSGPAVLRDAAIAAVQQRIYRSYLLNGNPVEVDTIAQVRFGAVQQPGTAESSGGVVGSYTQSKPFRLAASASPRA